jgi:hypothetical protein
MQCTVSVQRGFNNDGICSVESIRSCQNSYFKCVTDDCSVKVTTGNATVLQL